MLASQRSAVNDMGVLDQEVRAMTYELLGIAYHPAEQPELFNCQLDSPTSGN
jgi:hypothetical protein